MKLKRNVLLCLALLLLCGLFILRSQHLFFSPHAAFEDACLGRNGQVLTTIGSYDAEDQQYFFIRNSSTVSIYTVRQTGGIFWTPGSCVDDPVHGQLFWPNRLVLSNIPLACAVPLAPEIARISLRLEWKDGNSADLSPSVICGDLHFWHLPDALPAAEEAEIWDCTFVFSAYGADGTLLETHTL